MLETWRQDLAFAGRALLRQPAFTALVALTLALGIGANTAIFTVVDAVLLKPLPYRDPDGLVMVWSRWINFDKTWLSEAEVLDYRAQSRTMADIAAWGTDFNMALTGDFEPLSLPASAVTANTFRVFGVDPVAGRVFTPEEDVPGGPDVAMLDEGLWRQVYGADPDVVGGTIQLQGRAFTVVGVVPSSFRLPLELKARARTLVWIPLGFNEAEPVRGNHGYLGAARLAPGATAAQASRELAVITERLNADGLYPPDMEFTAFAVPVADEVAGQLRTALAVLFGSLPRASYPDDAAVIGFFDALRENVGGLPGVERAAFVRALPLDTTIGDSGVEIEGRPLDQNRLRPAGDWQVASPGYFEAMGLKRVAGRFFTDEDRADSLPVVAVNERMAEAFWPGEDALGKRVRIGGETRPWRVVVGVVGNVRHNGIDAPVKPKFYAPDAQFGAVFGAVRRSMTLVVKTSVEPSNLTALVRSEVRRLDAGLPLTNVRTLAEVTSAAVSQPRFTMLLMGLFAGLALVLAAVGIYGVLAYAVGRRTREIGIRLALGAGRGGVRRMVLGQGLGLAAIGTVLGIAAAAAMTRLMAGLLYGVEPLDPWTFAVLPPALLAVASLAVWLPARRATRVDPVRALRYE